MSPPPAPPDLHTSGAAVPQQTASESSWRTDERDGPGDHWVTLNGNHVLIHDPQAKPQQNPSQQVQRDRVTILNNSVSVSFVKGISDKDRDSALAAIKSAVGLLNDSSGKLTNEEKKSIANIKTIDVDPTASRSSSDVQTGTFHVNAGQLAEGSARFATDIAHDSFHITQWQSGNASTGGPAEREATYFQIGVGQKIGLSEDEVNRLKNYADHIEDYKKYWDSKVTHPPH